MANGTTPCSLDEVGNFILIKVLSGAHGRFRVQARLALEYRKLGRIVDAVTIEDEVLHMLSHADADHPIVQQIREQQASGAAATTPGGVE